MTEGFSGQPPGDARAIVPRTREWAASAALVVAALMFGTTFLVVQGAVERADVVPFLGVRFLIACALLVPIALRRPGTPRELAHGVFAGGLLTVAYLTQTAGLQYTSSSSSAFITYMLVVLVPVMTAVLHRAPPTGLVVLSVLVAVVGLLLLSGGVSGFGQGEWLTLACAFAFAAHILVLARTSVRHDPVRLTLWQLLTVAVVCLVPGLGMGGYAFDGGVWAAAAFTGAGATALAFFCMVWAQRVVPPSRAALLLLLEPVSAAVLGHLTGERLGPRGLAGAGLILGAVVLSEVVPAAVERRQRRLPIGV